MEVTVKREQQEEDNIFRKGNIVESVSDGRVVIVTGVLGNRHGLFSGATLYGGSGKSDIGSSITYKREGFTQFNGTLTIKV